MTVRVGCCPIAECLSLVAFGPWNEGNPPKPNAQLKGVVLLKYSDFAAEQQHKCQHCY